MFQVIRNNASNLAKNRFNASCQRRGVATECAGFAERHDRTGTSAESFPFLWSDPVLLLLPPVARVSGGGSGFPGARSRIVSGLEKLERGLEFDGELQEQLRARNGERKKHYCESKETCSTGANGIRLEIEQNNLSKIGSRHWRFSA